MSSFLLFSICAAYCTLSQKIPETLLKNLKFLKTTLFYPCETHQLISFLLRDRSPHKHHKTRLLPSALFKDIAPDNPDLILKVFHRMRFFQRFFGIALCNQNIHILSFFSFCL